MMRLYIRRRYIEMYQEHLSDDESEDDSNQDDSDWNDVTLPTGQPPRKRWLNWKHWLFLVAIIVVVGAFMFSFLPQWQEAKAVMPTYLGLNHQLAAQVQITGTHKPQTLAVHITFFDMNSKVM